MKRKVYKGSYNGKHVCAFCKNWWDPTNSVIVPLQGGAYEFETNEQRECSKRNNLKTRANFVCNKYEPKM
ncbi:MAG: hypothetical protein K6G85_00435 [Eubacterium sp.]|nr:hypothetical protein [Eubacterium sp.]